MSWESEACKDSVQLELSNWSFDFGLVRNQGLKSLKLERAIESGNIEVFNWTLGIKESNW